MLSMVGYHIMDFPANFANGIPLIPECGLRRLQSYFQFVVADQLSCFITAHSPQESKRIKYNIFYLKDNLGRNNLRGVKLHLSDRSLFNIGETDAQISCTVFCTVFCTVLGKFEKMAF